MFGVTLHELRSHGIVGALAKYAGAQEEAIRLVLAIFMCYPIAFLYRGLIEKFQSQAIKHIFFMLSGASLCIFNFGDDIYHSFIAISITYLLIWFLQDKPNQLAIINFIFHMVYLLIAYYFTASNDYDILWTMPQCVLVLRMIGLGFDVADGRKARNELSKEQLETALDESPSFLELMGFAYFPCSFLVGPQFAFRRYKRFTNGEFRPYTGATRSGFMRMILGIIYLIIRQKGAQYLPDEYFLSVDYENQSFIWRLIYLGLWGKLSLYKYISIWLITEGSLMCIGISYAGKLSGGAIDWSGCRNVQVILLETGNTMGHYVQSFNVNTNQWLAKYVYKRLKFLNNRNISYALALGFLAVWHGLHSGYYMSFFIEFLTVSTEKQIESVYNNVISTGGKLSKIQSTLAYKLFEFIVLKLYNIIFIGWCFVPFTFLSYSRWIRVQKTVHYFGFVYVVAWIIINQIYKMTRRQGERKKNL